jgi:drug/metabolite transporter (DMT)-like permease
MAALASPLVRPYDPEPVRDRWRGIIAIALLVIFLITIAMPWIAFFWKPDKIDGIKEILSLILAPVAGLVGAATAFYYGRQSSSASGTDST